MSDIKLNLSLDEHDFKELTAGKVIKASHTLPDGNGTHVTISVSLQDIGFTRMEYWIQVAKDNAK